MSTQPTEEERKAFIKKLEAKATKQNLSLSEYIAETGGKEMRELLRRMIKAEIQGTKYESN